MTRDSNSTDFISSLTDAARANPVAAALIGGGALWLLVGNRRLKDITGAVINAAQPLADANGFEPKAAPLSERARARGDTIADQGHFGGQSIKDGVSSAVGAVKGGIADAAGQAGEMVRAIPNPIPQMIPQMQQGYGQAKSALSDLLDRQPLVLGAVGLAIGAAVAGAFPVSDIENEWAGPTSDDVKREVQARAAAVSDQARGRIDDLSSEVRGVAGDTVDRVKRAGQNAVAAARETIGAGANDRH
jgi:hypothetical protein